MIAKEADISDTEAVVRGDLMLEVVRTYVCIRSPMSPRGRRARVLSASDPTTLEIRGGDYFEDLEAANRRACLESRQVNIRF